jgi:hypothetical protein
MEYDANDNEAGGVCGSTAETLNNACFCVSLDNVALDAALEAELADLNLVWLMKQRCPHVFAERPVFVSPAQLRRMADVVTAVEYVVAAPGWKEQALHLSPEIARHDTHGVKGVFLGYDYHIDGNRLGLIEINTNAGGAMLNAILARAQRACCHGIAQLLPNVESVDAFEQAIVEMFRNEWRQAGNDGPLRSIAIVDEAPEEQYLYPEFLLFQRLLEAQGIKTLISDPTSLTLREGTLYHGEAAIDLVYNRLTDFYLESGQCQTLREAYLSNSVVLTPHPKAHALYSDKQRLADLTDTDFLTRLGVPEDTQEILLQNIPRTVVVRTEDADRLWSQRRNLFFKPVNGFGSRGAYRGDKLTRRVWQEILAGNYVAQQLVTPGKRRADRDETIRAMKFDLRAYVYDGLVQWVAARLYQGQTTNFRTEGGGFAPVFTTGQTVEQSSNLENANFETYTFLLDRSGQIFPLPHPMYVALVHAEAVPSGLAGQRFRLADWYVKLKDGVPDWLANEWYGWVQIDDDGRYDPAVQSKASSTSVDKTDHTALPSSSEHERLHAMVFGESRQGDDVSEERGPDGVTLDLYSG